MEFKDIGDVKKAVSSFRNDTVFLSLVSRWEDDFDLYWLKPYNAGSGYISYTSSSPRNLADKGLALQNNAKLLIQIPDETLLTPEREAASNMERLWYGILNLNDERLTTIRGLPNLRQQQSWYGIIRGSWFIKVFLNKNDKGETVPEIDIWDAYNTAYGRGKNGLAWAIHRRKATKDQIKSEFEIDIGKADTWVYDVWTEEKNGIAIEGRGWAKEMTPHGLDHCPIYYIQTPSMPALWHEHYQDTNIHRGEGIFAAARNLFPILNKTMSDYLTIVRRGVKSPLGYWSDDGSKTLDEDIFQVEKGAVVPLASGEKIEPILTPTMPGDSQTLLEMVLGEVQRSGFAHTSYGHLATRLSGFAIIQLLAAMETVIVPFIDAQTLSYNIICREIAQQFATGNYKPIYVRGRTSKNIKFGYPKAQVIRATDIRGDWHPEVKLEPILPRDDAQRMEIARLAGTPDAFGEPLLSRRTRLSDILQVRDPDLEEEKIDAEFSTALPLVRLGKTFDAQMKQGDTLGAQYTLMEMQQVLAGMAPTNKAGGGGAPPGQLDMLAAMGMGGVPSGETGLSPETMPPEAMGGVPAGAEGAI